MRPLILISNDDSVNAPGLKALIDCCTHLGDVIAVAPDRPHSGQSSALTVNAPLRLTLTETYGQTPIYAVSGTPVDCVKLAMTTLCAQRRPDAVFAGVNHGSNAGVNIIYSGTMGAVLEACTQGIPAAGFSLLDHSMDADFTHTLPWIKTIAEKVINHGVPAGVCLNVNFPADTEISGLKTCRAARGKWTEEYDAYTDPHGKPFYWLTGKFENDEPDNPATDEYWLARGFASVVPARPELTDFEAIPIVDSLFQ